MAAAYTLPAGTYTTVTTSESASAALIGGAGKNVDVVLRLPAHSQGKFIYVADGDGIGGASTIFISTSGPTPGLTIRGFPPGIYPQINRQHGSLAFLAGPNYIWHTILNEGGLDYFQNVLTSTVQASTITTDALRVSLISSGRITASNVSTNSLSTASAFVGILRANTFFTTDLATLQSATVTGTLIANGETRIGPTASQLGALTVNGTTITNGSFTANAAIIVAATGSLSNAGETNLTTTTTRGLLTISNGLTVTTGNLNANTPIIVGAGGSLSNIGRTDLTITNIRGLLTAHNAFSVVGETNLTETIINGTLNVNNRPTTLTGAFASLTVGADLTINMSTFTKEVRVAGNLEGSGRLFFQDSFLSNAYICNFFAEDANLSNLLVRGTTRTMGMLNADGGLSVTGTFSPNTINVTTLLVHQQTTLTGTLFLNATTTMTGALTATGDIKGQSIEATFLSNAGDSEFRGKTTMGGIATFQSDMALPGAQSITSHGMTIKAISTNLLTVSNSANISNLTTNRITATQLILGTTFTSDHGIRMSNISTHVISSSQITASNISTATLLVNSFTGGNSAVSSINGNVISTGVLLANAVFFNVQTL